MECKLASAQRRNAWTSVGTRRKPLAARSRLYRRATPIVEEQDGFALDERLAEPKRLLARRIDVAIDHHEARLLHGVPLLGVLRQSLA